MTLRVAGVRFAYHGADLLAGVDLSVAPGEQAFVLGPSGCGKTTLLRIIAGLERPGAGTVYLDGDEVTDTPPHRRRLGMMFQEPALFPHLDVAANVAFGLRYRGVARRDRAAEARRYLDMVGLVEHAGKDITHLSGGQRQRVALARTLAAKPRAVLLDEPFSALDRDLRDDLGLRVRDLLRGASVPALWVTHDEAEARRLGDAVWRMHDGRLTSA